ncbi:MAG: serine/threonine-protein phosphatase [Myxococcales bacterium]|nr:serine/threonine-protein phosphatase [Myxococcales bacterium]
MSEPLVRIIAAGDTHIGLREHNEDAILLRRELDLYALADGAGGENAGNVASNLALTTIAHRFEGTVQEDAPDFDVIGLPTGARRLSAAVHRANAEIVELAHTSARYQGMGTTVVAAYVEPHKAVMHLAHVGDSRCYRLRGGHVELLTQDHSLANDVLELAPELDDARAKALPTRVVTRALGMERAIRVAMQSIALVPGDRYLLCSDGLTDQLEEEQIADALRQELRPDALVKLLLDVAHAARARDNVAVVVLDVHALGASDYPQPALRGPRRKEDDDAPEIVILGSGASEPPVSDSSEAELSESGEPALTLEDDFDEEERISIAHGRFPKPKRSRPPTHAPPSATAPEGSWSDPPEEGEDSEEIALPPLPKLARPTDDEPSTSEWPAVKVVPAAPGKAAELQMLLHDLPEPRDERDPTIRFRRRCEHCKAVFDGPANVCPFCWKAVNN